MKEFYPGNKKEAVLIHDRSYGRGYIVEGSLDDEKAFAVFDYGLCEETWTMLGRIFETDQIDLKEVANWPDAECSAFVPDSQLSLQEVSQMLGYSSDTLAENYAGVVKLSGPIEIVVPSEKTQWLTENISRHFNKKIEAFSMALGVPNRIDRVQVLETLGKGVPFFIVGGLIEGRTAIDIKKLIVDNFEKSFPGCVLRKAFHDTESYEYAFTPEGPYMEKLSLSECPTFPQDRIDSRERVLLELPREMTEGEFIRLRRTLFQAGAVVECMKANDSQIIVHVPTSQEYGGTMGSAFESRMEYILTKLIEVFGKEPRTRLLEKTKLPSVLTDKESYTPNMLRFVPGTPKTKLAFIQKIDEIKTAKNPEFNQKLTEAGGTMTIPCSQGNLILVRKKAQDSAEVYHGVEIGEQPDKETALATYKDLVTFSEIQ